MATPKFDDISVQVSKLIGDSVATAATSGVKITATERNALVNKALMTLFNQKWQLVNGDIKSFIKIFPELCVIRPVNTDNNSLYTIASPNFDFNYLIDGRISSIYISVLPKEHYEIIKTNKNKDWIPTTSKPVMIEHSGVIQFFPAVDFDTKPVELSFIKAPVDPTTGGVLTQGGTYDSPFYPHWNDAITEIARLLFNEFTR